MSKKIFKCCFNIINTVSDESTSPQRERVHAYEETKRLKKSKGTGKIDVHVKYNYCTVVLEWLQFYKVWMITEQQNWTNHFHVSAILMVINHSVPMT